MSVRIPPSTHPRPAAWLLLLPTLLAVSCGAPSITDPTLDSDGDGLSDADELTRWGTNPEVADTDGDSFGDGQELNELGFDPETNNFLFNPRIADVPKLKLTLTSMPTFYLNYQSSLGGSRSFSTSYADSSTTGTTRSWGGSQTRAIEMTHTAGVTMDIEHEFGIAGGTSIGLSLSYEFSHSTRNETSTQWSQEQSQEHTATLEEADTREQNESRTFLGGIVTTTVQVENVGNIAFRLESLSLATYVNNPENPFALGPLGNLSFRDRDFPPVTLSPGGTRGPLNFTANLDEPTIRDVLQDSRNLVISPATYTLTGPNGEDLQLNETGIAARTAHVVIDFGLERPQEVYRVATIRNRESPGLTVRELFEQVLRIPYQAGTFPWDFGDGVSDSFPGIAQVRDVAASEAESSYWIVAHTHAAEGGATVETDYLNPLLESAEVEDLILQKGDVLHLVYIQDSDRDGLGDRSELVYGTDPANPDTDGDGCGDSLEVGGWLIEEDGVERRVRPNPLLVDTDEDTLSDCEEYHAVPRTDPDGKPDNVAPAITSFTRTVDGMSATLTAAFSEPDPGDRVSAVRLDWGDGTTETVTVGEGTTAITQSHDYAATGTYTVTAIARDTRGSESASATVEVTIRMPTEGLIAHYRFEDNVLDSQGKYGDGSYIFNRYATGRSAAAGKALDPRELRGSYGLFVAPHLPFSVSFTISGWVSASSISGSERIWGQGDWFTLKFEDATTVGFSTLNVTTPERASQIKATGHPADTWTHYTAVVSGNYVSNESTISLYRDGEEVAAHTVAGVFTNPGTCRFYVGGFGFGSNECTDIVPPDQSSGGLNGMVDDLRIYDRALSLAEVGILASENRP